MKHVITLLLFTFIGFSAKSQIVINEYGGANISDHADNYGNYVDWIELYNPTSSPVDITGWYFSDKVSKPFKSKSYGGSVPANGYFMVYCSGRDELVSGVAHTSFKLTQTKPETIMISDPSGTIVDSITMKPCQRNHSRGRTNDGALTWSLFTSPTANAANSNPKNEYVAKPTMDVSPGIFTGGFSVNLATTTPSSAVFYTTDGSTPSATSTPFTGPIAIATTTVLRAIAITTTPNTPPSFVETNTYFINISHTMPIISIAGDELMEFITDDFSVNAFGDDFDGAFEYFTSTGSLIDEGEGYYNKHGNDSWAYDQRGFDFVMVDQYGYNNAIHHPIFRGKNRNKYQKLIIKAAANDNYPFETGGAHIRDAYVHSLSQIGHLKLDERSYQPCVLYINGQYWGLYDIREKVDDNDFTKTYYDQNEKYNSSDSSIQFLKTWGTTWSKYGGVQAQADWDNLKNYIAGNNMATQANFDYVDSLYNWKSLVDYFVLNSYIVSADWLDWNTAWWRGLDPNGDKKKWRYTLWDMDATFGHYTNYTGIPTQNPDADPCNPEALPDPGGQGHTEILNKLMDNPTFKQYYISRFIDLSNTTFDCDFMNAHLDSLINIIEPEMNNQINKWGGSYADWQTNVQALRDFIDQRCIEISQGMKDCYNLTGTYNLTFDVEPVNSGKIKANSIQIPNYPWSGDYYGGIDIILKAKAFPSYVFEYWELVDPVVADPDSADVTLDPTQDQTIIAHFKDEDDTTETIKYEGFFVPTAFSPNGDGQNDLLELFIGKDVMNFKFSIYNRWGELVFETQDKSLVWDGTYKSTALNTAVFVYQLDIRFEDGKKERRAGNITLMR